MDAITSVEILFCYAREDEEYRRKLHMQLRPLERQKLIRLWHDRDISVGANWEEEISAHLDTAQIILLLISPYFVDSEYCYGVEMERAIERHNLKEAHVIPIILRPLYWQSTPFGKLQALPTDAKPILSASWHSTDEAFFDVAEGVRKVVQEVLSRRWVIAGDKYSEDDKYEEALAAYEKAIEFDPSFTNAYKRKGYALYDLRRYKEALAAFRQTGSNNADLLAGQRVTLLQLRRYEEALAVCEEAIRLDLENANVYAMKGYILSRLSRYEEALGACAQALHLEAHNISALYIKCSTLVKLQRQQEAIATHEQAKQVHAIYDIFGSQLRGDALCALTMYEDAVNAYNDTLNKNVFDHELYDPSLHQNLGYALLQLTRYEEALAAYEKAIELYPDDALAYHQKALVLEHLAQQTHLEASQRGYLAVEGTANAPDAVSLQFSAQLDDLALLWTLEGHTEEVRLVAISPDGLLAASLDVAANIKMWDLQTGTLIGSCQFDMPSDRDNGAFLAFSLDGYIVIAAVDGEKGFALWNSYTAGSLGSLEEYSNVGNMGRYAGATSPDGQVFIGGYNRDIYVWNLHNQEPVRPNNNSHLAGHRGIIRSIAISPDGHTLTSGDEDRTIKIWDLSTMQPTRTLTGHRDAISALAISPDGQHLVSGSNDKTIKIWALQSGKLLHTLEEYTMPVQSLIISPDGQELLSGDMLAHLRLWNVHQGTLLRKVSLPGEKSPGALSCITLTSTGRLFVCCIDGTGITIWGKR